MEELTIQLCAGAALFALVLPAAVCVLCALGWAADNLEKE